MDIGEFRSNFLADFHFDGFVTIFAKLDSPAQRAVVKTPFFLVFSHQDALPLPAHADRDWSNDFFYHMASVSLRHRPPFFRGDAGALPAAWQSPPTNHNLACIDHGPVHVTITGLTSPRSDSSLSTNTSLFVGVRPRQRPFTFSSNNTSTFFSK